MGNSGERHERIGVCIFGLGRAGHIHANNIIRNAEFELLYIVEEELQKAEEFVNANFLNTKCLKFAEAEKAMSDPRLHGVLITSTTHTHKDIVLLAIAAKKAIFCEKPLAAEREDIEMCYKQAAEANVPILCAFNRRFDPGVGEVRSKVEAGAIGQTHVIKTTSRDHPLPKIEFLKQSGGILHDCASHDIDMICWVLGEFPETVFCQTHCFLQDIADINDVDTVVIVMKFASGIMSVTDLSRNAVYGYDQRLEVFGDKGMVQNENYRPTGLLVSQVSGTVATPIQYSFPQRYKESYQNEMQHFSDIITKGVPPLVKGNEVVSVCKTVEACEESLKLGKIVTVQY